MQYILTFVEGKKVTTHPIMSLIVAVSSLSLESECHLSDLGKLLFFCSEFDAFLRKTRIANQCSLSW